MKNSKTLNTKNQSYIRLIQRTISMIMITILFININTIQAQQPVNEYNTVTSKEITKNPIISKPTVNLNSVYGQLFNAIKSGQKCYQVKVSSVSTKNNNYGFVTYALGNLERDGDTYNLIIKGLSTEIDDRNNFQGAKTEESMVIYTQGNGIGVSVNLKTWGNKTLRLTDVKLNKERYGYFITGKATEGNRTVYYTIGIYEYDCLI